MNNLSPNQYTPQMIADENARFMTGVYKWMSFGIIITGMVAYMVANTRSLIEFIYGNSFVSIILILAQLGSVVYLSARIQKMSAKTATVVFLGFSALMGLSLSSVFIVYTGASIQAAFFVTAIAFTGLSLFGFVTKRDLGPIGTFCHMGLYGLFGFMIISWFAPGLMGGSSGTIFSICGVIIFAGLTAYDTKKIKETNILGNEGTEEDHKETIIGALTLYLDFINLFIFLLRLVGDRR